VAAGARSMGAAAGALRDVRGRLVGATSFVVVAGAWRGPASQAFLIDEAGLQAGLDRAAEALGGAAGALAELAARLEHAQAAWDRAQRLAASAGAELDPDGRIHPTDTIDATRLALAGAAAGQAAAANHEAAAARRTAAARLDHAAALAPSSPSPRPPAHGGHGSPGPASAGGGRGSPVPAPAHGGHGSPGPIRRVAGWALEAGAEVATATHHLVAGAEARVQAARRLAAIGDDPAVRAAASRVAETAGRLPLDLRTVGALPLLAPVLDFGSAVSHGEPLARAAAGAIGGAVGADLGGRLGMVACGGEAAATQGVGMVLCPALTAVGGGLGAHAGKEAALHLYDTLTDHPKPAPPPRSSP
jgi:hypothetical protein